MSDQNTLQVNTSGAWKNVAQFDRACTANVIDAARVLSQALGGQAKFCVVAPDGTREWIK